MSQQRWLHRIGAMSCAAVALTACSSGSDNADGAGSTASTSAAGAQTPIPEPLAVTYDGGLYVLDGETLEVKQDIPLDGFLRVNPAGDEGHVLVTTNEGFRILDLKRRFYPRGQDAFFMTKTLSRKRV